MEGGHHGDAQYLALGLAQRHAGTTGLILGYLWFSAAAEHHGERTPGYDPRREPLGRTAVYEVVPQKTAATV